MDTRSTYGWIEIGQDDDSQSFVRALDMGGMVWEGKPNYKSFNNVLNDTLNRERMLASQENRL